MLTDRLTRLQDRLFSQSFRTSADNELLSILNQLYLLEERLSSPQSLTSPIDSESVLRIIVRPDSQYCNVCGRTIK